MDIVVEPGTYVLAVSGGVDSIVLLNHLIKQKDLKLIIAHFDHGIRQDSVIDRKLVQEYARKFNQPFVFDQGNLGDRASEDIARRARYDFLHKVRNSSRARAIITAHHKDDLLETMILQLLRGTGRRGLSPLSSSYIIHRPMLHLTKQEIIDYAKKNSIVWHEDNTNFDTNYKRNFVRHNLIPKLDPKSKQTLLDIAGHMKKINQEIDNLLDLHLHVQNLLSALDRLWFISLPHGVAKELLAHWLRRNNIRSFDKMLIEKLVVQLKTLSVGQSTDVNKLYLIRVSKQSLALERRDR